MQTNMADSWKVEKKTFYYNLNMELLMIIIIIINQQAFNDNSSWLH